MVFPIQYAVSFIFFYIIENLFSEMFWNILKHSRIFWNILKYSIITIQFWIHYYVLQLSAIFSVAKVIAPILDFRTRFLFQTKEQNQISQKVQG